MLLFDSKLDLQVWTGLFKFRKKASTHSSGDCLLFLSSSACSRQSVKKCCYDSDNKNRFNYKGLIVLSVGRMNLHKACAVCNTLKTVWWSIILCPKGYSAACVFGSKDRVKSGFSLPLMKSVTMHPCDEVSEALTMC